MQGVRRGPGRRSRPGRLQRAGLRYPAAVLTVTGYQMMRRTCGCGHVTIASPPPGVTGGPACSGPARSARAAGPGTWPDQPRPPPDRRRRRAGPGGICRGWSAAAQAGAGPASPMAGGAGSHGLPRRLRSAGRGSRSPGGHNRVDEAMDTAQSERPQRALSSPGARHRVRPAAGGRGSPRPVQAARRRDVMPAKGANWA